MSITTEQGWKDGRYPHESPQRAPTTQERLCAALPPPALLYLLPTPKETAVPDQPRKPERAGRNRLPPLFLSPFSLLDL